MNPPVVHLRPAARPALLGLRPGIVLALVVAAVFCVYLAVMTAGMPAQATDWAMYVMHARNILHGRPYAETEYVLQPETLFEGAKSYPSGFPLMLVPFYAAFGLNVRVFKIVTDAALALSLWPIYIFSRRFVSPLSALVIIVATAFGWEYVLAQNSINSDSPFQFVSFGAIVFVLWIYDQDKDRSQGSLWGLLVGLVLAGAYLTRPIGIALVLAVLIADIIRRRRISGFAAIAFTAFVAIALLNNLMFHKDGAYSDQFILSPVLMARHAVVYFGYLSHVFANPVSNLLRHLLWAPSVLLAAVGVWTNVRRNGLTLLEIYCGIVLGVLSVYWVPNTRYLLPLIPIYLVYIVMGADVALEHVPKRYRLGLRIAGAAALLVAPAMNLVRIRTFNQDTLIATPAFDQLCQQIGIRTGVHDYVLFWNPRVLAMYTGRPSSPYPLSDAPQVQRFVNRVQPNYVVFDKDWEDDQKYLAPVIDSQPQRYVTIYENQQFKLTQVAGAPDRRSDPPAPIP